jgi:ATP synthase protein I
MSTDNGGSEEQPARDLAGEDARIDTLEARLQAAREREEQRNKPAAGGEADANYRLGNRVLAELIGGIGGGAFVGWVIDWVMGNHKHWGLLVVMSLGVVVAFRNIIRISTRRPD